MPDITRLTPLAVMLLATLREGDMHPYELLRLLRERKDDRLVPLQKGTIYHTVARLERDGLLAEVGVDRDGNRPERTTYTLLEAGRLAVEEWVRAELPQIERPSDFRVALSEAHNLERDEVIALLDQRRALLVASVDEHHAGLADSAERGTPEQFLVELQRQSALLDAELAWQDALHARLADRSLAWGVAEIPEHITSKHRLAKEAHA
ncbi:MAG: transcriptional regulator [Microbacterium sp. 71-36]|uniref:PadR family transcriptional regulator n=1 Tax=unclassified Microbacterium TaxID=2609290 RepID=UPI00086F8AD9|nr:MULTISPECIES: PadR family transcriptional regulator [unclassified Microbacterium]MBN9211985.1 PadR family transcriptional regulator [Microbacterium sp.]ODT37268.1 MAG: transcriptional regulator [Microbacterium sp. SCN 71-17]OJV74414.1 MAG: transcriptional regulator [Microbacterium sp. 71-36]